MPRKSSRILTIGADSTLVNTRVCILRVHYDVTGTVPDLTLQSLRDQHFDLLLVCSSTPYEQATALIREAHNEFPHLCIVRLIPPDRPIPARPIAHAVITIDYRPENWLNAVQQLLTPGQKTAFA